MTNSNKAPFSVLIHRKALKEIDRLPADDSDIKVMTVYHARKLEKLLSSKTKRGAWRKVP